MLANCNSVGSLVMAIEQTAHSLLLCVHVAIWVPLYGWWQQVEQRRLW